MTKATIAIVTSGGIVPKGNPDRIESSSASKYGSYSIEGVDDLTSDTFETAHGGHDPVYANEDADRVIPVDVLRQYEKEGKIGKLHDWFYSTTGNGTAVASARRSICKLRSRKTSICVRSGRRGSHLDLRNLYTLRSNHGQRN
jgi:betaine reductase